jgi:hypothetical protein
LFTFSLLVVSLILDLPFLLNGTFNIIYERETKRLNGSSLNKYDEVKRAFESFGLPAISKCTYSIIHAVNISIMIPLSVSIYMNLKKFQYKLKEDERLRMDYLRRSMRRTAHFNPKPSMRVTNYSHKLFVRVSRLVLAISLLFIADQINDSTMFIFFAPKKNAENFSIFISHITLIFFHSSTPVCFYMNDRYFALKFGKILRFDLN